MRNMSMKSLCLLVVLAFCAGVASAGCGVKDTHQGTLQSVDADSNTVVLVVDGEEVNLTVTETTEVTDAEGNKAEVASLVGKEVKVVSEHAEIDSIEQLA